MVVNVTTTPKVHAKCANYVVQYKGKEQIMKPTHLKIKYTNGETAHLQVTHETEWRQNHLRKLWAAQSNVKSAELCSPKDLVPNPRYQESP